MSRFSLRSAPVRLEKTAVLALCLFFVACSGAKASDILSTEAASTQGEGNGATTTPAVGPAVGGTASTTDPTKPTVDPDPEDPDPKFPDPMGRAFVTVYEYARKSNGGKFYSTSPDEKGDTLMTPPRAAFAALPQGTTGANLTLLRQCRDVGGDITNSGFALTISTTCDFGGPPTPLGVVALKAKLIAGCAEVSVPFSSSVIGADKKAWAWDVQAVAAGACK